MGGASRLNSRVTARPIFLALLCAAVAHAEPSPSPSPSPEPGPLEPTWVNQRPGPLAEAEEKFDFGRYEDVVTLLRPLVDTGARVELPQKADRIEALRIYGIACMLSRRSQAAEAAFLLLLREEPRTHLDASLVPDEAVRFFERVRERYRAELVAAYRKNRGRRYAVLNFLPPVGQFMNHQRTKGFLLGGAELALLATNITSGVLLSQWQGSDHLFTGHRDAAAALMPVNIASFAVLLAVVVYGIVDGLVVGHRLDKADRRAEDKLLSLAPHFDAAALAVRF